MQNAREHWALGNSVPSRSLKYTPFRFAGGRVLGGPGLSLFSIQCVDTSGCNENFIVGDFVSLPYTTVLI